jgi:hypothetical protein
VYGASPDDLLPGERVNLFFAPDERHSRGYLVHFQDELSQMQGHKHVWEVRTVRKDGEGFTARVLSADRPLEDRELRFTPEKGCLRWRDGKKVEHLDLRPSDRVYLTWRAEGDRRLVRLIADAASIEAIRKEEQDRINQQVAAEGITGKVEGTEGKTVRFLAFATYWQQANALRAGQEVRLRRGPKFLGPMGDPVAARVVSQKNRGAYGSGVNDIVLELLRPGDGPVVAGWAGDAVVRLVPQSR